MSHDFQSDIDAVSRIDSVPLILDVVCRTTGMGFAAVARVTEDRWVACQVADRIDFGLKAGSELAVATTICNRIRTSGVPAAADDEAHILESRPHPTPDLYGIRSYISVPIMRRDGGLFGTLCAMDPQPAKLNNPAAIGMFKLFAELIATYLDAGERLASAEASLSDERRLAELRDQFVAVLGHDLRNPIAALDAGTKLLLRTALDEKARHIVTAMRGSVSRMADLVNNVMDFARGRLGGGFTVKLANDQPLEPVLKQVISELQTVAPDRQIETRFEIERPVPCDRVRIAQLLSNLLGNALTHGRADAPVRVSAVREPGTFELSVANTGDRIPPDLMENLFRPFFRGGSGHSREGLGLGLYIAHEIAKAHGGTLEAESSDQETRFTFRMPLSEHPQA